MFLKKSIKRQAIFSHTGQIHEAVMNLMFSQIKLKMELTDPQVQYKKLPTYVARKRLT